MSPFSHHIPGFKDEVSVQMEQAHKLFAPEYLELPQVLLEEQRHFIPKVEANALALQCGFKEDNWEYGLRVMEQVSFFLLFFCLLFFPHPGKYKHSGWSRAASPSWPPPLSSSTSSG